MTKQEWMSSAFRYLYVFLRKQKGKTFAFEDFRNYALELLDEPRHHNSWGALASAAKKEGLIKKTGKFRAARSPRTHRHPVRLWVAA